jgi:hypothetical protein
VGGRRLSAIGQPWRDEWAVGGGGWRRAGKRCYLAIVLSRCAAWPRTRAFGTERRVIFRHASLDICARVCMAVQWRPTTRAPKAVEEEHARRLLPELLQHEPATPNPPHWHDPPSGRRPPTRPLFLSSCSSCLASHSSTPVLYSGHTQGWPASARRTCCWMHYTHLPRPLMPVHKGARPSRTPQCTHKEREGHTPREKPRDRAPTPTHIHLCFMLTCNSFLLEPATPGQHQDESRADTLHSRAPCRLRHHSRPSATVQGHTVGAPTPTQHTTA